MAMDSFLTAEQQDIKRAVRSFAQQEIAPRARKLEDESLFPSSELDLLARQELMGMGIDPKYGGAGADSLSVVVAIEELARACAALSVIFEVHHSLVCKTIEKRGSKIQKEKYLAPLSRGEMLGAFALTEAGAGSDAAAIKTRALKKEGYYHLNGSKTFITSAGRADLYLLLAYTDPDQGRDGISAFLIEKGFPGFTAGEPEKKMGLHASHTGELHLSDCRVPEENLLGSEGEGYKIALSALDRGRIGIAAQAVGITQSALDHSLAFARERKQFGRQIVDFQAIKFMLAEMVTELRAARLLTYQAAREEEEGRPITHSASMAKLYASEMATRQTGRAIQIHGGYGYMEEYQVERLMREAKVTEIYEGTSEIQKLVIARELLRGRIQQ